LISIVSAIILQNTLYSNFLFKYFDQVIKFDASHIGRNGEILNFNNFDENVINPTEKANINVNEIDYKNKSIPKIGACRKFI